MKREPRNSRALIKLAARNEFAEHGFAGARIAAIAAAAGVNKQLIFYYFHSKGGLYDAVVADCTRDIQDALKLPEAGTSLADLRAALRRFFETVAHRSHLARLIVREVTEGRTEGLLGRTVAELRRAASDAQAHGHIRDDGDPDLIARQIMALVVGHLALGDDFLGTSDRWIDSALELIARWLSW